jgi:hypothetical protein
MLTDMTVSIAFMTSTGLDDPHLAMCCIDPTDQSSLLAGLARNADLKACALIEPDPVGTLSIYPHRSSITVLGAALQALNEHGVGVHAVASSISALTFVVDYVHQDKAAAVLTDLMTLPPGITPVRQELISASGTMNGIRLETIAVYWESKIRTYGFNFLEKLTLCQMTLPTENLGVFGKALQIQGGDDAAFRLVWAQTENADQIRFFLLCNDNHWNRLRPLIDQFERIGSGMAPMVQNVVDAICFQGPHFGDRSGIMDFTYQALANGRVPLQASTCSVATIYLVLPAGWGRRAQGILTEAFEIPTSVK